LIPDVYTALFLALVKGVWPILIFKTALWALSYWHLQPFINQGMPCELPNLTRIVQHFKLKSGCVPYNKINQKLWAALWFSEKNLIKKTLFANFLTNKEIILFCSLQQFV